MLIYKSIITYIEKHFAFLIEDLSMVELQTFQKHFNYRPEQCSNILFLNVNNFVKNFNHFKIPRKRDCYSTI